MKFPFTVSNQDINTKNSVIITEGIELTQFLNNPVALFNHDINKVIGYWEDVRINEINTEELIGTMVFDEDDTEALNIMNKVSKNLIKHASIAIEILAGFLALVDGVEILVVTASRLKEISLTALPANKSAIKLYYKGDEVIDNTLLLNDVEFLTNNKYNKQMKVLDLTEKIAELEKQIVVSEELFQTHLALTDELKATVSAKDKEIENLNASIVGLQSELDAIAVAKAEAKFTELLNDAKEKGKIKEEQTDTFLKLSYDIAKEIIDGLEGKIVMPEVKLTDSKTAVITNKKDERDYKWYEKNDPEALKLMYKEDRAKHDALEEECYGKQ